VIDSLRSGLARSAQPVAKTRSIWLLAFLCAVIGYVALLTHYEAQIADVETQIADIEGIVSSDALFARAQPHLRARRDLIVGRLGPVMAKDANEADAIGSFLNDAHAIAQRNGVAVVAVAQDVIQLLPPARPRAAVAPAGASGNPPGQGIGLVSRAPNLRRAAPTGPRPFDTAFVPTAFRLTLSGEYLPLLRAIAQLSDASLLVRIDRVALTSPGGVAATNLTADVRATVFRPTPAAAALTGDVQ